MAVRYRMPAGLAPPNELGGRPTSDGFVELEPSDLTQTLHRLTGWALEHGVQLEGLEVQRPSLEDVYLSLTGGEVGEE